MIAILSLPIAPFALLLALHVMLATTIFAGGVDAFLLKQPAPATAATIALSQLVEEITRCKLQDIVLHPVLLCRGSPLDCFTGQFGALA